MTFVDERTAEQKQTHYLLFGGTDSFLSGWGKAKGGNSYAFWACEPKHSWKVSEWVQGRRDIKRFRQVSSRYRPTAKNGHCHIYVVTDNHPALS